MIKNWNVDFEMKRILISILARAGRSVEGLEPTLFEGRSVGWLRDPDPCSYDRIAHRVR